MYVYIYIYECIYIDAYIHTYIHTYLHTCVCVCVCMHLYTYIYTYIHISSASGARVPADGIFMKGSELRLDESAMTGECVANVLLMCC
jgi:hypothetical protein